jgi:hypothetical protein
MPEHLPHEPEAAWVGAEDLPVHFANTFSATVGENAIFLDIGSMVPPILETEEQLANFRFVPVKPIARVALAPGGLDDLIAALQDTRKNFEAFKRELEGGQS